MDRGEVTHADASGGCVRAYDGHVPDSSLSLSALPSVRARIMAYVAILLGGLAGGCLGYAVVDLQIDHPHGVAQGIGILVGSIAMAGGMSIVSVLVLRALGEWREVADS